MAEVLSILADATEEVEERRAKDVARANARRAKLPEDWGGIRQAVFDRDGFACVYCGSVLDLQCDHVEPLSKGGSSDINNLVTACKSCNSSKGARPLQEWRGH